MAMLWAAISLGLLGSLHCVGMCGPIALSLPVQDKSQYARFLAILIYNLGRIITYSALGALFGLLGQGFAIFGLQQILSIVLGVIILLSVLLPGDLFAQFSFTSKLHQLFSKLKISLGNLFQNRSIKALFYIGLLNGLLPCGLIYMAITGALASGSVLSGTLFMALFGLGTVPAMFSVAWFGNLISVKFRLGITKAMPYVVSVMAVLLILRGMNLGIPYISPKMTEQCHTEATAPTQKVECCHK